MKVLFLTTSFPRFKGDHAGIFLLSLAKNLAAKGAEVSVVAPNDNVSAQNEVMDGIRVHRFNYFAKSWQVLAYGYGGALSNMGKSLRLVLLLPFFAGAFLARGLREARRADVIHSHWIAAGLIGVVISALARKPLVITLRGTDYKVVRKLGILGFLWRRVLRAADAVTTVSEQMAAEVEALSGRKALFIPNGVDLPEPGSKPDRKDGRMLFVGNLTKNKGVGVFLDALARLKDDIAGAEAVIIGDGDERIGLERQASEAGLSGILLFKGFMAHHEVEEWLAASGILVLPSYSEGRPNVVLEAMAYGLPVVATDIPGTRELVSTQQTGLLFAPGDAAGMAASLARFLKDPALGAKMGEAGKARLSELGLTWEGSAEKFLDCYREAIKTGVKGSRGQGFK
jgi:glycosyltransferase involved in cell wall biosynthesis